jgi:hypothetical protein
MIALPSARPAKAATKALRLFPSRGARTCREVGTECCEFRKALGMAGIDRKTRASEG